MRRWVVLALLWEQGPGRWFCFPLGALLFVPESRCSRAFPFQTKIELAAALLRRITYTTKPSALSKFTYHKMFIGIPYSSIGIAEKCWKHFSCKRAALRAAMRRALRTAQAAQIRPARTTGQARREKDRARIVGGGAHFSFSLSRRMMHLRARPAGSSPADSAPPA